MTPVMADHREQDFQTQILQWLLNRLLAAVRHPLDVVHLRFICENELRLIQSSPSRLPEDVFNALINLHDVVTRKIEHQALPQAEFALLDSGVGHPNILISEATLKESLKMDLSVPSIAKLLGVSQRTVHRTLKQHNLSVASTYSKITDAELDHLVHDLKKTNPTIGSRMVKGKLRAGGHRVIWTRIWESMRCVDGAGVSSRMAKSAYGCVVRRVYSVPAPLSLVHLDTNHKLIRYGFVIFGAVDGFSRKIMYMGAATDNKASTAFHFFLHAVEKHGVPDRVRADQGCENVDIARWMFMDVVDRGSFMAGKSVHNQRIERLWRDLWMSVTGLYYNMFHSLEEDGLLDPSDSRHLFTAQYVFLPHLQAALDSFRDAWDNHPLRTEQDLSPNQLCAMGRIQNPVDPPTTSSQDYTGLPTTSDQRDQAEGGVVVPSVACPVSDADLVQLSQECDPCGPSENLGQDIYMAALNFIINHSNM